MKSQGGLHRALFASDRICAVIAAPTATEAARQLRFAMGLRGRSRTLEVRLDYLPSDAERALFLKWLARHLGRQQARPFTNLENARHSRDARLPTIIATCRTRRGGGEFNGSAADELKILVQAVQAGCRWCDVEIETAAQYKRNELRRLLAPARLLVSAHDFHRLPPRLSALTQKLRRAGGHAIKIAAVCSTLADTHRLLALAHGCPDVVVIPMSPQTESAGAQGTRVLALREGSALAYASVSQATAPGQLSLEAMKETYRLNRNFDAQSGAAATRASAIPHKSPPRVLGPARHTRVYGVIGDPVAHSLSPLMHNTAFAERHLDAVYLPFHVRDLDDFIAAVRRFGISGFSVTLPHKRRILRYLDRCEPLAAEVGAVNTVVVREGKLSGYNTDYVGVLRAIESRMPLRSSRVLLVGAGGVARAAAFALARSGAKVMIWARRRTQSRALARAAGGEAIDRLALRRKFFDAIVNCTPVGMHPGGGSPLEAGELNARIVMDLIYRPQKTVLLFRAEQAGIETISGVEMFLEQGVAQWELWTGQRAPRAAMRRAVVGVLDREERLAARPPARPAAVTTPASRVAPQ